jgi:glutamate--cysteine ligase
LDSHLQQQLDVLERQENRGILVGINRGIEKESLRIDADGRLAQTPHPSTLGSALTHPSITTDYSEALLELITPVSSSIEGSLRHLEDIHSFVYQQLGDEMLWTSSMPCVVAGDTSIPVAQYGTSNVAKMKTVYRYGLGHRYGRLMQTIAGIHYNFSMPQEYWEIAWRDAGSPGDKTAYISERYLGLIRNFRRYSWLLIYLYGASPAVCASFLRGRDNHGLQPFDTESRSLYLPYATALRMGGLGYTSDAQKQLNVCYNSLENYVATLSRAILQPHAAYRQFPAGRNGDYQQLNDSLLQIENEFYSPIRPKRVARSGEPPLCALTRAGIEYIEVRCVDISPFLSVGIDASQIRFLDSFLLFCLLEQSPPCADEEQVAQATNLEAVVNRGRQPGLLLAGSPGNRPLAQWADELLDEIRPIASLLDSVHGCRDYSATLEEQQAKVTDPGLTPSARVLREMRERDQTFYRFGMNYSQRWAEYFRARPLSAELEHAFRTETERSLELQREIEQSDDIGFEQYLKKFYAQYQTI